MLVSRAPLDSKDSQTEFEKGLGVNSNSKC